MGNKLKSIIISFYEKGYLSKSFKENLIISIISFFILTLCGWLLSRDGLQYFISYNFALASLISIVISILILLVIENWAQNKQLKDHVDKRLGKIIEYFALNTGNVEGKPRFEYVLEKMRNEHGNVRWVIAKYFSRKMCKHFHKPDDADAVIPDIDKNSFVAFVEEIIVECTDSLQWTCPFTPEEWFRILLENNDTKYNDFISKKCEIDPSNFIMRFHNIIHRLKKTNVKMTRIVNLDEKRFEQLTEKCNDKDSFEVKKRLLESFIDINGKSCDLYFVNIDKLFNGNTNKAMNRDFGIYDDSVVIFHENDLLYIELDNLEEYRKLFQHSLFSIGESLHPAVKKGEEIKKDLLNNNNDNINK